MTDENSNLLKLLKVRVNNLRCHATQLHKSKLLSLEVIDEMKKEFSHVESLLDINNINLKKDYKYAQLKEEALKAIAAYRNIIDAIMEKEQTKMYQEEKRYLQKINQLGKD